jgi:hypothetical protein
MWSLIAAGLACAALAAAPGCELLVDFDRSKIPPPDGGTPDVTTQGVDSGNAPDSPAETTNPSDGEGSDAPAEATTEGGADAPADSVSSDVASETETDGGSGEAMSDSGAADVVDDGG